jgi:hypothetical protein
VWREIERKREKERNRDRDRDRDRGKNRARNVAGITVQVLSFESLFGMTLH